MTGFLSAISFLPVHKLQREEEEEEEEVIKDRGHGRSVTSESPAQDPELTSDVITTER